MPRQLERRAVALVHDIYGGEIAATPDWLVRPGRNECLAAWPLIQGIYHQLTGQELPETMRPVERRTVDAVLCRSGEPPRIFEFDEKQHFNSFRAQTLRLYPTEVRLAYPKATWLRACESKTRLEGGGFAAPRPPLFPGDGGRHLQRAFRDALSDLVPLEHGWLPTLRFADFQVREWVFGAGARERLAVMLDDRLAR